MVSVLLIDGSETERHYYADRLKRSSADYLIHEASTAKAGLELCRSQSIDCVVLELELPDTSGFEVLVNLVPVARSPKIAVIVLTRLTYLSLVQVAVKNGAQAALLKSQTSDDMLDQFILRAISTVTRDRKAAKIALLPTDRLREAL